MSLKRSVSPELELIANPFIKKRNLEWDINLLTTTTTTTTDLTQPQPHNDLCSGEDHRKEAVEDGKTRRGGQEDKAAAEIEAGQVQIDGHLAYFSDVLKRRTLPTSSSMNEEGMPKSGEPQLSIKDYKHLYGKSFGNPNGAHFVVHQHDHPVAGTHYDLRLQINETSSVSWAMMYGLPGNPNSRRLNRNATETRIHCLWNHLIETASIHTGSLLIWDTGTYEVLPYFTAADPDPDPDSERSSSSSDDDDDGTEATLKTSKRESQQHHQKPQRTQQDKLRSAFSSRKIRLALHGTRLPEPYIINMRLTRSEDVAGRSRSERSGSSKRRRRRRSTRGKKASTATTPIMTSDEEEDEENAVEAEQQGNRAEGEREEEELSAMEKELREIEDEQLRLTNAYPGATNNIGSVHQRKWYVSLDRVGCGFEKRQQEKTTGSRWVRLHDDSVERQEGGDGGFPFYVRGAAVERSVVTGRKGEDVLRDEGVVGFVGRKGWKAVLN